MAPSVLLLAVCLSLFKAKCCPSSYSERYKQERRDAARGCHELALRTHPALTVRSFAAFKLIVVNVNYSHCGELRICLTVIYRHGSFRFI